MRWCSVGWSATAGRHTLRWELDYNDSVAERDETNNTVSATWTTPGGCVGDCDGRGGVTVDELLTMVNIALGNTDVSSCGSGDENDDGRITVDEILTAVNAALEGCG